MSCLPRAVESPAVAAQDAAEALIALGWPVLPHESDHETWKLGDFILTDSELLNLAALHGVMPAREQVH